MATLVGVFNTSHSPTAYAPAEKWNEVRASRSLRADVDTVTDKHRDTGTADFLTGLLEQHEKSAWMLRSFLE